MIGNFHFPLCILLFWFPPVQFLIPNRRGTFRFLLYDRSDIRSSLPSVQARGRTEVKLDIMSGRSLCFRTVERCKTCCLLFNRCLNTPRKVILIFDFVCCKDIFLANLVGTMFTCLSRTVPKLNSTVQNKIDQNTCLYMVLTKIRNKIEKNENQSQKWTLTAALKKLVELYTLTTCSCGSKNLDFQSVMVLQGRRSRGGLGGLEPPHFWGGWHFILL